jgi:hypothetical protein
MNRNLALRVLGDVMKWTDERATDEFRWLRLISTAKYDDYSEFLAGVRFIESLAAWLQQFSQDDRETAYSFVRNRLVYIGSGEMQHLVELAFPESMHPLLLRRAATMAGVPHYLALAKQDCRAAYRRLRRSSLFLGLSDGARIDAFRRANQGLITNEQVATATEISPDKWDRMLENLREEIGDATARFSHVFLIDDFVGTGKTLLRLEGEKWTGKLARFWSGIKERRAVLLEDNPTVIVHHYVASHAAAEAVPETELEARAARGDDWFNDVKFTFGMTFPEDLPVTPSRDAAFYSLTQRYYDAGIESAHSRVGGDNIRLGFGNAALPVVLEHNTPNNSVALLWAESTSSAAEHAMRPLFRRRQRHT